MSDWLDDRERIAARVEDVMAGWHDTVERVAGEDGDADSIVGRDGDRVSAILLLDEENVEALAEADADGTLAQWLREELAEDDERDEDDAEDGDDELDAAADAWLGDDADPADALPVVPAPAAAVAAGDDDDFDLDDWDDPEADALIDELPR
ncbi:hypothetical protein AA0Z99_02450 [Agrococcus sp. 1P02AA]|uniref:hypothetical protein n=1 Tax=Agrococcus sp. 1P02AA TaxID=3132259 RepID=UPI0039A553E1